jgi:Mrp family chromosome partitioning ATPase
LPLPAIPKLVGDDQRSSTTQLSRDAAWQRNGGLLEQLATEADLVVVDTPPLLPVADTQALLDQPQLDAYLS